MDRRPKGSPGIPAESVLPSIVVDSSGSVHVVWEDDTLRGLMRSITRRARWGSHLDDWQKSSAGLRVIRIWATSPLVPPTVFTWSGVTTHLETLGFITRRARMGEPPGQQAKGSPGLQAGPMIHSLRLIPRAISMWSGGMIPPGTRKSITRRARMGEPPGHLHKRITWTSGSSDHPFIAADPSGNLHVVWSDDTPGNRGDLLQEEHRRRRHLDNSPEADLDIELDRYAVHRG